MPIHVDPRIQRSDQSLVVDVQEALPVAGSASGTLGTRNVTLRPSTRIESLANSIRDFFSFGMYSRLLGNPSQWKKLRTSLLHDAQQSQSGVSEVALQRLFLTYSDSSKLTTAKLNNILADYERAKNDPNWQPQLNPKFSEATRNPLAVAARSIQQLARKLTPEEQALKELAAEKAEEYSAAQQEFQEYLNTAARGGETHRYRGSRRQQEQPAVISELGSGIYAAKAMQHILRPGRTMNADDLSYYMAALQREAKTANQYSPAGNPADRSDYQLGYKIANWHTQPVGEVFAEARQQYYEHCTYWAAREASLRFHWSWVVGVP